MTEKTRFEIRPGRQRGVWTVIDTHTGQEVMRDRDETLARRFAAAHNEQHAAGTLPTSKPAPAPTPTAPAKPAMRPGWSKAAQRRAGRTGRSHPLGQVVEAGAGYTIYEDTAFGGGRVQIWDES